MKYASNERGMVPVLVIVLVVALIAVVGIAVYNVQKSQKDAQTGSASPSASASMAATASPVVTPTPSTASDQDLITQAVKAYNSQSTNDTVSGITIVGANAKGNGASPGAPSGYEFIAHKDGGAWKVVYKGQEKPGKALGQQYGLPTDWYSTAY